MQTNILAVEQFCISRQRALDKKSLKNNPLLKPTPLLEIARMCLSMRGVCNHWTATYRRGTEGFFVFRNPENPGVLPLPWVRLLSISASCDTLSCLDSATPNPTPPLKEKKKSKDGDWFYPMKKNSKPQSSYKQTQSILAAAVKKALAKTVAEILNPKWARKFNSKRAKIFARAYIAQDGKAYVSPSLRIKTNSATVIVNPKAAKLIRVKRPHK